MSEWQLCVQLMPKTCEREKAKLYIHRCVMLICTAKTWGMYLCLVGIITEGDNSGFFFPSRRLRGEFIALVSFPPSGRGRQEGSVEPCCCCCCCCCCCWRCRLPRPGLQRGEERRGEEKEEREAGGRRKKQKQQKQKHVGGRRKKEEKREREKERKERKTPRRNR